MLLLKCCPLNVVWTEASPPLPAALFSTPQNGILPGLNVEFYFKISLSNVECYFLLFINRINYSSLFWIKPICYFLIFNCLSFSSYPKAKECLFLVVSSLIRPTFNKLLKFHTIMLNGENNNKFLYNDHILF